MDPYLKSIVDESPSVLIDFYADWCAPCKLAAPVLEDVVEHFDGKVILRKIDIDQYPEIAKSLYILSVPTIILFREGKEVWRIRGFDIAPAMIRTISEFL